MNMREQITALFPRNFRRRGSLLLLAGRILGGLFILQVLTAIVLFVVAKFGKREKHDASFPHIPLKEVQVNENRLQLYSYGRDLFDAMLADIDAARESIFLETYIWKDDDLGREFQEHLARKAEEGVAVYVVFDHFGNLVVPRSFKEAFHPAIHVLEYRAIRRLRQLLDPRCYALDHRKLLIVDGDSGFIGGYNLGALYATQWRDTHLRLHGSAARELAHSFIGFWNRLGPEHDQITLHYHHQFDPLITVFRNEAMRVSFPIRDMYIAAIDEAEHTILLTTAYFVPDHMLLDSLKAAAQRGVDVRVLVPWISNHVVTDWVAHSYFNECLQAGIRIIGYRYTMLHAKTCTIDGQWSTVGTANLDRLSLIGNYEINAQIYSPDFAQQMNTLFECDTADVFELTLEKWNSRPWYVKASERILYPWRIMM